jgi:hypothetical protein
VLRYDYGSVGNCAKEETLKRPAMPSVFAFVSTLLIVASVVCTSVSTYAADASGKSAKDVLASALTSARKEIGCAYTTTFTLDDHPYVLSARAGSTAGEQLISYNGAQIDVREVDDTLFIYANADGVKLQFGEADPTWANRWIEVTPSDTKFSAFASGVLLGSTLDEVPPATIKGAATSKKLNGKKVIAIAGKPNSIIGLSAGKETLYLSAASPNLPVKLLVTDKPPSEVRKLTIAFSDWGKSVAVVKPTNATLLSKTNLPD